MHHSRKTKHPPPPDSCTYCGEHFEELTWDHVWPYSWFPDQVRPATRDEVVVPACIGCQQKASPLEEKMRQVLILDVNISERSAKGVLENSMRALRPWSARDARDRQIRQSKRDQFEREVMSFRSFEDRVPGVEVGWLQRPSGLWMHGHAQAKYPPLGFNMLSQKLCKGLYRLGTGEVLDPSIRISGKCFDLNLGTLPDEAHEVAEFLRQTEIPHLAGGCLRFFFRQDQNAAVFLMWNTHLLTAKFEALAPEPVAA